MEAIGDRAGKKRCVGIFSLPYLLASVFVNLSAADAPDQSPTFTLHSASGATHTGPLEKLGDDWSIQLGGDKPSRIEGQDVVSLRRADLSLPGLPASGQIILANGDHIPGRVEELAGDSLRFRAALGTDQVLSLPLSVLSVIWLAAPEGVAQPERLRRSLEAGKRTRDIIYLRNGDVIDGIITALDDKGLQIEANKKEVAVELNKLAVIAFNTDLVRMPRLKEAHARLVLANGCRLTLASARADAGALVGKTPFGAEVKLPAAEIAALDIRQGRAVYLSDLKPTSYEFRPYLDEHWPYALDSSVLGRDLRLAGSTYDKGLGMHSASRLTYDLAGGGPQGYRRFEALVGLDDQTGRQGSARIMVLVDGKPQNLGWDKDLTGQDKPIAVRVNVQGARELTLVVGYGRTGPVQGHVNWADARVIK